MYGLTVILLGASGQATLVDILFHADSGELAAMADPATSSNAEDSLQIVVAP
jgi:hypothetical protein